MLELEAQRVKRADEAGGKGALGLEKAAQRKRDSTARKLKSSLAINEERVADALKVNTLRADNINQLRRGRKDFMIQMRKLDERDRSTVADMKHFAQGSNVSLDEKEKFEAKLKRHLFEYSNEVHSWEHTVAGLDSEISSLDTAIKKLNNGEEAALEAERRAQYMQLKRARDGLQKRELRLGYLQNQVRGQEMDFQRLHRIMGVKFLPEKPESVQATISATHACAHAHTTHTQHTHTTHTHNTHTQHAHTTHTHNTHTSAHVCNLDAHACARRTSYRPRSSTRSATPRSWAS